MRAAHAVAAALAVAGFQVSNPVLAQSTLTLSSWVPPSHAVTSTLIDWGKEVEKASAGRIKFNLLAKAITPPPGTFDGVRDGLADVSFTVDGYTPGRFVLTRVIEFPFMGANAEINSVAYQRIHERHLARADEHKGVKVLAVFAHGPGGIYTTKKPVRTLADLSGLKFRIGGGIVTDLSKELGMNVLLRPAPELFEILSNGVADGALGASESISAFKLEKLVKYYTDLPGGLYSTSFTIFMNPAAYAKLSAQDRAVIDSLSGERLARQMGRNWTRSDDYGLNLAKQNGAEYIVADKSIIDAVRAKVATLENVWFAAAKAKGVDGPKALADLRDEVKKVSAERR